MRAIDPLLVELIESLPTTPAVVTNERFDVLASNAIARSVSPSLTVGVNLAEATFVNLSAHRTIAEWDKVSARMAELVQGIQPSSHALEVKMDHPDVGMLEITYELLWLPDPRQIVIMGHTAPGSESEQRLFALAAEVDSASS